MPLEPVPLVQGDSGAGYFTTQGIVTTQDVPADHTVVVVFAWYDVPTVRTLTGIAQSGNAYAIDIQRSTGTNTSSVALAQRYYASGLASGATITVTFNGSTGPGLWCAFAIPGDLVLDGSTSGVGTTGTALNAGSVDPTAEAILIAAYHQYGGTAVTGTPDTGTELYDRYTSAPTADPDQYMWAGYKVVDGSGPDSVAVTVNDGGTLWAGVIAAYTGIPASDVAVGNRMRRFL